MTVKRFVDRMVHDGRLRKTDEGYAVQARVARGGNVQMYLGSEMGVTDKAVVRVYRPETEVFSRDAISSYARKPVTIGHPSEHVTPDNWKDLAVGEIDRDVMRDGEFVSVPLLFRDAKAVELMQSPDGPKELSMGYDAAIRMEDGVTPNGEAYDAIMYDFKMNHVAVVPVARGGSELRIGDGADHWGATPITDADKKEFPMTLRKIMVDGLEVETTDAGAAAIAKIQKDADALAQRLADAETAHAAAIAAKDAEIAKKDAAIDDLKGKQLSDADLDKRVADRAALLGVARTIAKDAKFDGLSDAAVRKAAVAAKLGDAAIDGKSDAYIEARFDMLAEDAADPKQDGIVPVLRQGGTRVPQNDAQLEDTAFASYLDSFNPQREEAN